MEYNKEVAPGLVYVRFGRFRPDKINASDGIKMIVYTIFICFQLRILIKQRTNRGFC
jgi:hypothetical protein